MRLGADCARLPAERCAAVVEAMRRELGVASWRFGRAPAWMRPRPGYDRFDHGRRPT